MNQTAIALSVAGFLAASVLGWAAADVRDARQDRNKLRGELAELTARVETHELRLGVIVRHLERQMNRGDSGDGERLHR